jgi:hypothetical protein
VRALNGYGDAPGVAAARTALRLAFREVAAIEEPLERGRQLQRIVAMFAALTPAACTMRDDAIRADRHRPTPLGRTSLGSGSVDEVARFLDVSPAIVTNARRRHPPRYSGADKVLGELHLPEVT